MMYLANETDRDSVYVFASKAGAPANPDWYSNLTAASVGTVAHGTGTYRVTVHEAGSTPGSHAC